MSIPDGWITILARFRSVGVVVAASTLGIAVPGPGSGLEPLVGPLVAMLVYTSIRAADVGDVLERPWWLVSAGLIGTFLALPVVAFGVGRAVLPPAALAGVVVVTAGPTTTGSALVWARLSDADVVLTAGITFVTLFLAPVVTPLVITGLLGTGVSLSPVSLLIEVALVVAGGFVLAWIVPAGTVGERGLDRLSLAVIGTLVYVGIATSPFGTAVPADVGRVAVVALCVTVLVLGAATGAAAIPGVGSARGRALFFATGLKNLGVAVVVSGALQAEGVVVAVVTYYVIQQLVAGLVVARS
ncbi:bile acid:sodium symporter family protein [Halorhabdus amylolytica]|uniref:bile acid:sodium symporter family protein n=1 Tax=Halorhabdus amylolytica TaxID=2559573 RepID=UPI0010AAAE35|nr:bile acid:sodium symporter [Halorhabdus amylolytica]